MSVIRCLLQQTVRQHRYTLSGSVRLIAAQRRLLHLQYTMDPGNIKYLKCSRPEECGIIHYGNQPGNEADFPSNGRAVFFKFPQSHIWIRCLNISVWVDPRQQNICSLSQEMARGLE
ncbi:hypothetical protein LSH36_437g03030 [Paralvinella palmiformis]|uniref:Uncharacterized protein n=1 Tax=Paralvinella palmiformis TaxID=53620 RepID=A0AAD9MZT6_9ANNE|nr:hypothetical protein LSH36_437g03030 [Paralvinella palmiformis]